MFLGWRGGCNGNGMPPRDCYAAGILMDRRQQPGRCALVFENFTAIIPFALQIGNFGNARSNEGTYLLFEIFTAIIPFALQISYCSNARSMERTFLLFENFTAETITIWDIIHTTTNVT